MKYLVAVSGGVDSVVLLDRLVKEAKHELTVAHFDHGIRSDSAADARFVEALALQYDLPYVGKREELGEAASEDKARQRRYAFLRAEATKRDAKLVTAHHKNDVIETVTLNLLRGTGWRGLAVLDNADIERPLLGMAKSEIRDYALKCRLEWVEDSTNAGTKYLRNRIRRKITHDLPKANQQAIVELWQKQRILKKAIEKELLAMLESQNAIYSRYFFTMISPQVGSELLRAIAVIKTRQSLPRPQLALGLQAIKTARPHTSFSAGALTLTFDAGSFIATVKTP